MDANNGAKMGDLAVARPANSSASTPTISIVLPSYNGGRFLRETLDSLLAQTRQDWELLAVDDASTDDTPAILAEYAARDPRITARRNATNRRLPASLNIGFATARGRYLTWFADDNCYRPDALARMAQALDDAPDLDFVYARAITVTEDGQPIGAEAVAGLDKLPFWNCIGACFLYRRGVQEALGGYDEGKFLVEDYDFFLRAATRFRLALLDDDLMRYRRHATSLTATRRAEIDAALDNLLLEHLPHLPWLTPETRRDAYDHRLLLALERDDLVAARRIFVAAQRAAPSPAAPEPPAEDAFPLAGYAQALERVIAASRRENGELRDGLAAEQRERRRTEAAFRELEAQAIEQAAYIRKLEAAVVEHERRGDRSALARLLRR